MTAATAFRHDEIFVGFTPIDELHREFQYLLDLLIDCPDADYGQHLVDLHEHLLRHCGVEEEWMRQERYPGYARHKRDHEELLENLSEVRRRFDAGDIEAVRTFSSELMPWFAVHAQTMDAPLAAYLKGA
jgi:hemerythrin-like metal-binding protein